MSKSPADPLDRHLRSFFEAPVDRLGVAVSGGGDSVALMCLLANWSLDGGPAVEAVTVNHGLRPEADEEARFVANLCARLKIPHTTLAWDGPDATGNLMKKARSARYRLLAEWAAERGIASVALGHTQDDVAEGFVSRLARGSGLDGLSAMATRVETQGQTSFVRPLLAIGRADLRKYLQDRGQEWIEDPTNQDDGFERARVRKTLDLLDGVGVSAARMAETSLRLRAAREELSAYVSDFARNAVTFDCGDLVIPVEVAHSAGRETLRRILQAGVMWISGAEYVPRSGGLDHVINAFDSREGMTLGGCRAVFHRGTMRLTREWKAVAEERCSTGDVWDGRWRLTGPGADGAMIAALGEDGLACCPDRKATGRPAASLIASPAIWRESRLIAAPLAGLANGWSANPVRGDASYFSML